MALNYLGSLFVQGCYGRIMDQSFHGMLNGSDSLAIKVLFKKVYYLKYYILISKSLNETMFRKYKSVACFCGGPLG